MPTLDSCHQQTVRALQKGGLTLESTPSRISTTYRTVFIDLKMSRVLNGSRQQILLIEVKCFPDEANTTRDLYTSIGQYLVYRAMLGEIGSLTSLYLTVPETVFRSIFDVAVMRAISDNHIKLVIVNIDTETIVRWIE